MDLRFPPEKGVYGKTQYFPQLGKIFLRSLKSYFFLKLLPGSLLTKKIFFVRFHQVSPAHLSFNCHTDTYKLTWFSVFPT